MNIIPFLEDNKCEDICVFECKTYISQHVIVATVLGGIHAVSVAEKLLVSLKNQGEVSVVDGHAKDGWAVIEIPSSNTMVHLMTPQKRAFFNLEEFLQKLSK